MTQTNRAKCQFDKSDVLWHLDKIIADLWYYRDQRSSIKKWCITIWFASVAPVASGTLAIPLKGAIFMIYVPLVFFWALEGFYGGIVVLKGQQIRLIEQHLWNGDFTFKRPHDLFLGHGSGRSRFSEKVMALGIALRAETVWVFYLILSVVTLAFLVYFY